MSVPIAGTVRREAPNDVLVVLTAGAAPAWAVATGARAVAASCLEVPDAADAADVRALLRDAACVLLDAEAPGFVAAARRLHALDPAAQVVAVARPAAMQATRRALLYAPGLGEVWIASPSEVNAALAERAGGVTRQRRRFDRARARLARERVTASPQRAERALLSDAYLAGLLRALPDAVFSVDDAGRVLSANDAAERRFGRADRALVGAPLADALGLEAIDRPDATPAALFARASREGHVEVRFTDAGGTAGVGELRAAPFATPFAASDAERASVCAVVLRDVTEQHATAEALRRRTREVEEAASALREREAQYRTLFEEVPVGLYRTAPDGRLLDANPTLIALLGYPDLEALQAVPVTRHYVDPDDRRRWREVLERDGVIRGFEVRLKRRDGETIWTRHSARVVRAPDGPILHYEGAVEDVTERRRAEDALREGEVRFRQLAENTNEMLILLDPGRDLKTSRVLYVSPAYARMTGRDLASLYVPGALANHPVAREDRRAVLDALRAVMRGESRTVEYRLHLAPPGEPVVMHTRLYPVPDADGRVYRVAGFTEDVTEQRALEARLRQGAKLEAVGQLAGGIAHDFNNLLTVISGNLEFARGDLGPDHPVQDDLAEVAQAAERARTLVRQLLAFSRKQVVRPRDVDLNDVVQGAETLLRRVLGDEIVLVTTLAPAPAVVRADRGQLEQVLMNLAVNARDAMLTPLHGHAGTGGALALEVDTVALGHAKAGDGELPAGRYVRLRVRDTGHGMDAETRAHLFEPFFTTKAVGRGTGLGLSMVFGIVQQAAGTVRVESAPGRGTTFTILLPASDESAVPDDEDAPAPVPSAAASATVLLVEDEGPVRAAARRMLERRGYVVLEARHGADALLVWRERRTAIDAVVTDLRMPELGGRDLIARLHAERPDLPVVYLSGYADQGAAAVQSACERFVEKPFTTEALLAAVADVLASRAPPEGGGDLP